MADEEARSTTFPSTTGGVMTEEAGAVTGELEVETRPDGDLLRARVRYAGAAEWYAVSGSPLPLGGVRPGEAHERVVGHLSSPGRVVDGNEEAVTLRGLGLP